MIRIRHFEEKSAELYSAGKIRGFLHLYIGEEAIATGAMRALGAEDAVFATYREHGHALVRGVPAGAVMAEMYGKVEGCSRGRGGSMHLFDARRGFFGGSGIVAGALPMATGYALAQKLEHRGGITAWAIKQSGFGEVLPGAACFVIDEAHQAPETASRFFSLSPCPPARSRTCAGISWRSPPP